MFFKAYPASTILSQEAHEELAKLRATGMFQGFLTAIRQAIKDEQVSLDSYASRNLSFTRMVTDLRGSEVKKKESARLEREALFSIN